jgi:hypothetical protein
LHDQSLVGSVVIVVELSKEDYGSKGGWKPLDARADKPLSLQSILFSSFVASCQYIHTHFVPLKLNISRI